MKLESASSHFSLTRSSSGINLLELMAVTAILATLAAVSIQQYQSFQVKARQVEAKLALSTMYSVEKLAFSQLGKYSACLKDLGYSPSRLDTSGNPAGGLYALGFSPSGSSNSFDSPTGTPCANPPSLGMSYWNASQSLGAARSTRGEDLPESAIARAEGFKAGAVGMISGDPNALDIWMIKENQQLFND